MCVILRCPRYCWIARVSPVKSVTRADGFELTYTYNAAQQLTRITDNSGNYVVKVWEP